MLSRLSQLQNRWTTVETQHLTTWRRLFGATLPVAAIAAAGAATDGQDRGLDVPWEGIAVFDLLLDHPDFAATAGKTLGSVKYRIVKEWDGVFGGTMPMHYRDLRQAASPHCAEDAGQSRSLTLLRANE